MTEHDNSKYTLSAHAQVVIAERKIAIAWIERVLYNPEKTESDRHDPQLKHSLGRIEEFGGRVLRVIYNPDTKPMKIITAYFDRTARDKI
jgi:hypothetical protein